MAASVTLDKIKKPLSSVVIPLIYVESFDNCTTFANGKGLPFLSTTTPFTLCALTYKNERENIINIPILFFISFCILDHKNLKENQKSDCITFKFILLSF
nr:hypothetical protein [Prevotella denticola]